MGKFLLWMLLAAFCMPSCNFFSSSYGKPVKINDSLEVYIKGDSTAEADAKKLGNYLAELWKENGSHKTIQLQKDQGTYFIRMVGVERMLDESPYLENVFVVLRDGIEENVFPGKVVKFVVTNEKYEEIRVYQKDTIDNN